MGHNMCRTGTLILGLALAASFAFPQGIQKLPHAPGSKQLKASKQSVIEITQQDFTKAETLRSTNLTVFGIHLGQPEQEAAAAAQIASLVWTRTSSGNIDVRKASGKCLMLISLVDGEVVSIDLESDIAEYLKGDAKKLLSTTVLEPQSSFRMAILGHEDERKEENEFIHYVKYSYFKEGIEIQGLYDFNPPSVKVVLFLPAKVRSDFNVPRFVMPV
jgi:hypothetical protein